MTSQHGRDLSIIVVSYNTCELLASCLESVHSTVAGVDYEVIVVDNASTDGSPDLAESEFGAVRLIRNAENVGFARANNQAIRESRGRYVLLLNSDAVLLRGAVATMVVFMDHHPEVGAVGAQLVNPDGTFQWSHADFPTLWGELLLMTGLNKLVCSPCYPSYPPSNSIEPRDVDWVSGACMMVRRSAIDKVGVLDESYFMYSEETDWCYRLKEAGWRVFYLPEARVVHWSGKSSDTVPEAKRSRLYQSKLLFMRKHRGPTAARAYKFALHWVSLAKLAWWSVAGLDPRRSCRKRAILNARSYLALLEGI